MRENVKGQLLTHAYGKVIASHIDPIEKKPFYHFLMGSASFSIAAIGCNFRCDFCQNFTISQRSARDGDSGGYELKPEEVVREAKRHGCAILHLYGTDGFFRVRVRYLQARQGKRP
jgi:pyruvate formate lyase activating enzyme